MGPRLEDSKGLLERKSIIPDPATLIETTNLAESVHLYSSVGAVPVRLGFRSVIIKWFDRVIELREKSSYDGRVRILQNQFDRRA